MERSIILAQKCPTEKNHRCAVCAPDTIGLGGENSTFLIAKVPKVPEQRPEIITMSIRPLEAVIRRLLSGQYPK